MKTTAAIVLSAALLIGVPAHADVFSSQNFSGDTAKADSLPGVNLQGSVGAALSGNDNCKETFANNSAFTTREPFARSTTCQYGNFSITTTNNSAVSGPGSPNDVYGGNPPPWEQGWRPK